jgi:hypothetical protein
MEDFKVGAKLRLIEKPDSVHGLRPNLALLVEGMHVHNVSGPAPSTSYVDGLGLRFQEDMSNEILFATRI